MSRAPSPHHEHKTRPRSASGEKRRGDVRPYDLVADLIGSVKSGDPELSVDVGRKVALLLRSRLVP